MLEEFFCVLLISYFSHFFYFMQILAVLVVFFGEFLMITSEIFFAKGRYMYAMIFMMFIA